MTANKPGFVVSLFTGRDNASGCIVRVMAAFALVMLTVFVGFIVVVRGQPFETMSYTTACTALITAAAAGVRIKAGTEPGDHQK